jgi:neutral ceramidase
MPIKVGFAERDITPPLGTRMAGFFEDRMVEAVHDPLYVRAMAIDNGEHPLIMLTCDLLSLRNDTVARVRDAIVEATGLAPDSIAMSTTHTHTGPATSTIFTRPPNDDYVDLLVRELPAAAVAAWEGRQPARLGLNWGFEGRLSHNRRFVMRSTRQAQMHPPKGSTDILYKEGRVDPELGVISARAEDGTPLGCLLNFACHVNVVGGSEVSADYPGYFAAAMKARQGEGHVGLFANGCCGNLCQIDVYDPDRHDWGHEWARHMGERLADDVLRVEAEMEFVDEIALDARLVEVELPARRIPDSLLEWAGEVRSTPELQNIVDSTYAEMAFILREEARQSPTFPGTLQALRIGDVGMVMLPGEVFVEFGLQIKQESPALRTFVVELSNGVVGYVPTKEAFEWGGYEQRSATSSRLAPVAGEFMVDTALALLDSMFL